MCFKLYDNILYYYTFKVNFKLKTLSKFIYVNCHPRKIFLWLFSLRSPLLSYLYQQQKYIKLVMYPGDKFSINSVICPFSRKFLIIIKRTIVSCIEDSNFITITFIFPVCSGMVVIYFHTAWCTCLLEVMTTVTAINDHLRPFWDWWPSCNELYLHQCQYIYGLYRTKEWKMLLLLY